LDIESKYKHLNLSQLEAVLVYTDTPRAREIIKQNMIKEDYMFFHILSNGKNSDAIDAYVEEEKEVLNKLINQLK
jgi:hypothetical protein